MGKGKAGVSNPEIPTDVSKITIEMKEMKEDVRPLKFPRAAKANSPYGFRENFYDYGRAGVSNVKKKGSKKNLHFTPTLEEVNEFNVMTPRELAELRAKERSSGYYQLPPDYFPSEGDVAPPVLNYWELSPSKVLTYDDLRKIKRKKPMLV